MSAWIERKFPLHASKTFALPSVSASGLTMQHRQLIAGRLTRQTATAQSQLLAVAGIGRDVQRHRATQRRHFDLTAQRRFPGRQRQFQGDIASLDLIRADAA